MLRGFLHSSSETPRQGSSDPTLSHFRAAEERRTNRCPCADAYLSAGALDTDAEQQLVRDVTNLLIEHELRSVLDLTDDPATAQASRERAGLTAWTFVHRVETYVAGQPQQAPFYKFVASIPEGNIDDVFRDAVVPAIVDAVARAEAGKWPHTAARVWVFTQEIPDGTWGAAGRNVNIGTILNFVAPGFGENAEHRLATRRREAAVATLALAEHQATA